MKIVESKLQIRKIEVADLELLVEIEQELFPNPWSKDMFLDEISRKENFSIEIDGIERSGRHSYLLEYSGEVIGFFFGWAVLDEYSIMNIGIRKSYQHLGLGSFLLQKQLSMALDLKCRYIYLEVRKSNESAIKLYEKYNFERVALRKDYYSSPQEDAIVMKLDFFLKTNLKEGNNENI
ncbi:MAG: ribosomal-protein-alanine N-acetyltransferase [Candidatus Cloacimonetes bacterium 4572_65]|nr:MAG: ribosomal-protein-alanine N-acetyltransferase [Candidatus Cloacimonetes bacterium 4572_65]